MAVAPPIREMLEATPPVADVLKVEVELRVKVLVPADLDTVITKLAASRVAPVPTEKLPSVTVRLLNSCKVLAPAPTMAFT